MSPGDAGGSARNNPASGAAAVAARKRRRSIGTAGTSILPRGGRFPYLDKRGPPRWRAEPSIFRERLMRIILGLLVLSTLAAGCVSADDKSKEGDKDKDKGKTEKV